MKGCPQLDLGTLCWARGLPPAAQACFDRGLRQFWGFNHEDALAHFEDCLALQAGCVEAAVFAALCLSPNYNNEYGLDLEAGRRLLARAQGMTVPGTLGAHLLAAAAKRLEDAPAEVRSAAYADALADVAGRWPDEAEVACLHAEAVMNKRPWALWPTHTEYRQARETGRAAPQATSETLHLCGLLEAAGQRWPRHPGVLHLTIHFWELSPTPERGLPAADALWGLCPDSGHLQHMPSHIYMWVGMYTEAVQVNRAAVEADDKYVHLSGHPDNFYLYYRVHNIHFVVWAAMFACQEAVARQYAARLELEVLRWHLTADNACYLEAFAPLIWMVLIRFGRWEEILHKAIPEGALLCTCRAVGLYAKALAAAATGRLAEADRFEADMLHTIATSPDLHGIDKRGLHNNAMYDPAGNCGLLNVAKEMARGELLYRRGEFDAAFAHLRTAVRYDDELKYDEPWTWMVPARHALGALLLEQGRTDEAVAVFRADLGRMPHNPWGMRGLRDALVRRALPADLDEADQLQRELAVRARGCDFVPRAACACAQAGGAAKPLEAGCCAGQK
mmetsp:Transcript_52418/g.131792  ORF Transcript_52418/g.131792 Transcript_52418/m.131792 type:complete len:562 (-) Transcript_52418:40-1725(-)